MVFQAVHRSICHYRSTPQGRLTDPEQRVLIFSGCSTMYWWDAQVGYAFPIYSLYTVRKASVAHESRGAPSISDVGLIERSDAGLPLHLEKTVGNGA